MTRKHRHHVPGKIRQGIAAREKRWLRLYQHAVGYYGPELGPTVALKIVLAEEWIHDRLHRRAPKNEPETPSPPKHPYR